MKRAFAVLALVASMSAFALAQRPFDATRERFLGGVQGRRFGGIPVMPNPKYDGQFTSVATIVLPTTSPTNTRRVSSKLRRMCNWLIEKSLLPQHTRTADGPACRVSPVARTPPPPRKSTPPPCPAACLSSLRLLPSKLIRDLWPLAAV